MSPRLWKLSNLVPAGGCPSFHQGPCASSVSCPAHTSVSLANGSWDPAVRGGALPAAVPAPRAARHPSQTPRRGRCGWGCRQAPLPLCSPVLLGRRWGRGAAGGEGRSAPGSPLCHRPVLLVRFAWSSGRLSQGFAVSSARVLSGGNTPGASCAEISPCMDFKYVAAPCSLRDGEQALPRCFTTLLSLCSSSSLHGSQLLCAPDSSHS